MTVRWRCCWTSNVRKSVKRKQTNWHRGSTPNVVNHADVRGLLRDVTEELKRLTGRSGCVAWSLFAPNTSTRTSCTGVTRSSSGKETADHCGGQCQTLWMTRKTFATLQVTLLRSSRLSSLTRSTQFASLHLQHCFTVHRRRRHTRCTSGIMSRRMTQRSWLGTNKHCQLDPASTWLVKQHRQLLAPFIALQINTSLSTGSFPAQFKHAIVTPLLKKGSPYSSQLKSSWLVSDLPFLSKLLEKVVQKHAAALSDLEWCRAKPPVCIQVIPRHWDGSDQSHEWPSDGDWSGTSVCTLFAGYDSCFWHCWPRFTSGTSTTVLWYQKQLSDLVYVVFNRQDVLSIGCFHVSSRSCAQYRKAPSLGRCFLFCLWQKWKT